MPRKSRVKSATGIYHVMFRGNEKKNIFNDDRDKFIYLKLIKEGIQKDKIEVFAYCLMSNHVHLLLKENSIELSRSMKSIGTSYALYFNKKYSRVGHLFQDRFRSEPVLYDEYLMSCARYIHNNPVKAGICAKAINYRWSSLSNYLRTDQKPSYINTIKILNLFSEKVEIAKNLYMKFSQTEDDKVFIDIKSSFRDEVPEIKSIEAAEVFVTEMLNLSGLNKELLSLSKYAGLRNDLIFKLRKDSHLSIRQIAG